VLSLSLAVLSSSTQIPEEPKEIDFVNFKLKLDKTAEIVDIDSL